jgi:drug/metabolite transporter (DMT)-like permease
MVTVVAFGLYTPVAKAWLADIPPMVTTGLMYLSAGLTLLVVLGIRRAVAGPARPEHRLRPKDLPVMSLGVTLGLIASPLLLVGISEVSGMVGSLLCNLEAVFTVGIALLLGDRLKRLELAGAAAILAGGAALSYDFEAGESQLIGVLAIAASCLFFAADSMTTRKLSGRDSLGLMTTKCLFAGSVGVGLAIASGQAMPDLNGLLVVAAIGVVVWAASMVCFVLAMRQLGAAKVGSMLAISPFIGAIASILGLGDRPTMAVAAAGVLMAIGAWWLAQGHLGQDDTAPALPVQVESSPT